MKIDFTYLETLSDGDPDFVKEFIRTFEETTDSLMEKMKDQYNGKDWVSLGKTAHQMKPSAKMFGLESGDKLEEIQNSPMTATEDIIQSIENECYAALEEAKRWAREKGINI